MARFRTRSSRTRSANSRSWLKSVLRFRRHFPRLLRSDFWRSDAIDALWQSLFRRKKMRAEKRRRNRRTGVSGWSPAPIAFRPEALEARAMLSAAGFLDNQFNTSGMVTTRFTPTSDDVGSSVVVAGNGDLVVAGSSNNQFALAVYSPSGTLLSTTTTAIGLSSSSQANALAIDPSGNIVAVGMASNATKDLVVARYTLSGGSLSLDVNFNGVGYTVTDINGKDDQANAVVLQPTGGSNYNIVAAGQTIVDTGAAAQTRGLVARYTQSGALDTGAGGFGGGAGFLIAQPSITGGETANGVAVTSTAIVLAGHSGNGAELLSTDASGSTALARTPLALGATSNIDAITVLSGSGEYLVAGTADSKFVLAEVQTNLTLDSSFGTGGKTETAIGSFAEAASIAIQKNGKIDIAGFEKDSVSTKNLFAVARYSSTGALDSSAFGSPNGYVTTDFSGGTSNNVAAGIAIQSDGKIVVAGTTGNSPNEKFAVARYIANNAPTASGSYSFDPVVEANNNSPGNTVASIVSALSVGDIDGDSLGIAITAVDDAHGTWQYSTDSGAHWTGITTASGGTVSNSNALLLASSSANMLRFVPNPGSSAFSPVSISVRGWDQTHGSSGGFYDTTSDASNNLNSISDNTLTASIAVDTAAATTYVNAAWAGSSQGQTVSDSFGSHTFGVDAFATIQDGVNLVASAGTVHIDSGTYFLANLLVANPVTIVGVSESGVVVAPAAADGHDNSAFGGSADNAFIIGASGVTIEDLTIDGNANMSLGGSQNFRNAIVTNSPNSGVSYDNTIVDQVTVENIYRKGIGLFDGSNNRSIGNQITNNTFDAVGSIIGGSAYEATAAIAVFGSDTLIDHNIITHSAGGIESNGFPAPLLTITNNSFTLPQTTLANGALGIDAASLADGSTVSGNTINLTGSGTAHNDIGIVVSFVNGSVTVSGNAITATGGDDGILLYQDSLSTSPVLLSANTIQSDTFSGTGILLTDQSVDTMRFGDVPGAVYATITGGQVSGFARGILATSSGDAVQASIGGAIQITGGAGADMGIGVQGAAANVTIGGTTIIDPLYGILVDGGHASVDGITVSGNVNGIYVENNGTASIANSHILNNSAGVLFTTGGGGSLSGDTFQNGALDGTANLFDLFLDGTAGAVTDLGGNAFYATGDYILDASSQNVNATGDSFNGFTPATDATPASNLGTYYGIENRISDYLDQPSSGYVKVKAGYDFLAHSSETTTAGAMQRLVNASTSGDTAYVQGGTYIGSPQINKSLILAGAGRDTTRIDLLPPGTPGTAYLAPLFITGSGTNATVEGFTIVGSDAVGNGLANSGIVLDSGLGTIRILNNRIETGQVGPGTTGDDGIGLLTTYTTNVPNFVASLDVEGNEFTPSSSSGFRAFYVNTGVTSFEFKNNTIDGNYAHRSISEANNATIELNTISGVGSAGSRSAGIGVYGDTDPTTYGHALIANNTFSNLAIGVSVLSASDVTVQNNLFTNNDTAVLFDDSNGPPSGDYTTDVVHDNSMDLTNTIGLDNTTSTTIDATNNWWGSANGPATPANTYNVGSQGSRREWAGQNRPLARKRPQQRPGGPARFHSRCERFIRPGHGYYHGPSVLIHSGRDR